MARLFLFLLLSLPLPSLSYDHYPSVPGASDASECSLSSKPDPIRREVYGDGKIFDVTHRITADLPSWDSGDGRLGQFLWFPSSIKKGNMTNNSEIKLPTHTGTHVDAPGHFIDRYFDAGFDVDTLDLDVLNGPGLLVDVPRDKTKITAEVMESLNIPKGIKRVLFRTSNTERGLMYKKEYDTSYVGFSTDGAKWLVENTDIKLVGIDYLSVAADDDLKPAHLEFLESKEIIPVEGLKLDDVPPGLYSVHCLPIRLLGAEGAPETLHLYEGSYRTKIFLEAFRRSAPMYRMVMERVEKISSSFVGKTAISAVIGSNERL